MPCIAACLLLQPACATVRRPASTTVSADARYGELAYRTDDPQWSQTHRIVGSTLAVRHEFASGARLGGGLTGIRGDMTEWAYPAGSPSSYTYRAGAISLTGGWRSEHFDQEFGVSAVVGTAGGTTAVFPWPWYSCRVGELESHWLGLQLGSRDGQFLDLRLLTAGGGLQLDVVRAEAGFGLGGTLMYPMEEERVVALSNGAGPSIDVVGWLDLRVDVHPALTVVAGGQVSQGGFVAHAGVEVYLDTVAAPQDAE